MVVIKFPLKAISRGEAQIYTVVRLKRDSSSNSRFLVGKSRVVRPSVIRRPIPKGASEKISAEEQLSRIIKCIA